VLLTGADGRFC
jgi:enoyl-CoA hydratase/carnithine racemase